MRLHVHTTLNTNTGKCYDVIDAAIDFIHDQQMIFLEPIGLQTTTKIVSHNLRTWFSHRHVEKYVGRMMQRHQDPNDPKMPIELRQIIGYMATLEEYNTRITGDCRIETRWVVG